MSTKLTFALAAFFVFGLSSPSFGNERPSKQSEPVKQGVRSTATILPGVRLMWSSPAPGGIDFPELLQREDVSVSKVVSKKTHQVTLYVDFS